MEHQCLGAECGVMLMIPCTGQQQQHAEVERLHGSSFTLTQRLEFAQDEIERLTVELTHRVGWEERCLRAEKRIAELEARPLTEQEQLERYGRLID